MTKPYVRLAAGIAVLLLTQSATAQAPPRKRPVIDVHVHSTTVSPSILSRYDSIGIRYFFLGTLANDLDTWSSVDTTRFVSGLIFPCDGGHAPITGRPCFSSMQEFPDTTWLREQIRSRRVRAFGEMSPQYMGLSPADPRLEPYWRIAEEFDLPVGLHMGPTVPGIAYDNARVPFGAPRYRAALSEPMLLEEVLLRHKKLRVILMHAGYPRAEETIALLHAHPGVYVDVAALQTIPRVAYHHYLQALVDAGFAKRIMFGSDFPNELVSGIDAIASAPFLSVEQKADILCSNAARFLRLAASYCQ
ncbi:MAG: amidohydrolase family protein [Gemmatimonadaceae bacterium]|nr:amidohydrolase family protein [Gemmatimonadaceae bacterium]